MSLPVLREHAEFPNSNQEHKVVAFLTNTDNGFDTVRVPSFFMWLVS